MFCTISQALSDIRAGRPLIVVDDEQRENEGDLVVASEKVTPEIINFFAKEARGLICTPVSKDIAGRLDLYPMVSENTESSGCNFAVSVDAATGIESGISAFDRAHTIQRLIAGDARPSDFVRPGHVFPLRARDGGVLVRAGHTEASVDLARLAGLTPSATICEIMKQDGTMARLPDLKRFAKKHKLHIISIAALIAHRRKTESLIQRASESTLATRFGPARIVVYTTTTHPSIEHVALVFGTVSAKKTVLTRVHSQCLTGDIFASLHCDCGDQLHAALHMLGEKGGVLLYLQQEGRGIGLAKKIQAYSLQRTEGLDTVQANERLGFPADLREYGIGAQMLADLGCRRIRLLTNNPKKIAGLSGYKITIAGHQPLKTTPHKENSSYLATKKKKLGHLL